MPEKDNSLIIEFKKPIKFEGKEVKKIDLSGLENIKTKDLIEVEKQYGIEGNFSSQPETTVAYARLIGEKVSDLPLEFFDSLKAKEILKVRNVVVSFFYEED